MRLLVLPALVLVASCSWMPNIYPKKDETVVVPLAPAPNPSALATVPLVPAPDPEMDKAQQVLPLESKQDYVDPMALNQQQYQLQAQQQQQMLAQPQPVQAVPMQPQYYYAIPAQPQALPPQYQQPYYQQPQPVQPQFYAPAIAQPPQAAPMLGQSMPHTFTTGKQFLSNDPQVLPGEDDFPEEYGHIKPQGESNAQYIKRDDLSGQKTQIQPTAPPLMGQPQKPVLQGR